MSFDTPTRTIATQAATSFIGTTLVHWAFKRNEKTALMGGFIAAIICVADAVLFGYDKEYTKDTEGYSAYYKAAVAGFAVIAIKALLKQDVHWKTTVITSALFFYTSHYFIWLK